MLSIRPLLFVCLAAAGLVLVAAACGDDDDAGAADEPAAQKAQVLAALTMYRAEGLHEIDDEAQEASEIDPEWRGRVTRMRRVTAGVDWPEEFAERAATLEEELALTEEAIDAEDLGAVKEHILASHEAWHEFEEQAYQFFAGEELTGHEEESASPSN